MVCFDCGEQRSTELLNFGYEILYIHRICLSPSLALLICGETNMLGDLLTRLLKCSFEYTLAWAFALERRHELI